MSRKEKQRRLEAANRILVAISSYGRRFFFSSKHYRVARFEYAWDGHLRFIDEHTGKRIFVENKRWRRGFSNGGTLRRIVEDLSKYIIHGCPFPAHHLGPWHKEICDGDLWGYGTENMDRVRADALQSGVLFDSAALKARAAA